MDWEKAATNFGLPGLMLVLIYALIRLWMASNERVEQGKRAVELEKVKVEDKKADAMASALTSLSGKIDSHHTNDLQSHEKMSSELANLHGKIDTIAGLTPVRGVPQVDPP
jgi:uncharacterized protein YlxW (UPF0749 family)